MKTIYKYILLPMFEDVEIPSNSILSCESQGNNIVVYAIVDTEDLKPQTYKFKVVGTGHQIDFDVVEYTFLNTVKIENESIIFHVFYKSIK